MSKPILSRVAAGMALTLLTTTAVLAQDSTAVHGVKTVGAMTLATQGLATNMGSVHRQGGYALPGAVQWTTIPADEPIKQAAF